MQTDELRKAIAFLEQHDIQFSIYDGFGATFGSDEDDIVELVTDGVNFWARHFEVSREQFVQWRAWMDRINEQGEQCEKRKGNGQRCKQPVKPVCPREFKAGFSEFCGQHQNGSSNRPLA